MGGSFGCITLPRGAIASTTVLMLVGMSSLILNSVGVPK
jgi:hypothetical protein